MGNLFTTLLNTTGSLRAYSRSFNVIQNNIANAYTPGYVKQDQVLLALPFDPAAGLPGGVLAGPLRSTRSPYLEQAVRDQQELLGHAQQRAADLSYVESLFDLRSEFGIPGTLNQFFNGFSQLAVNPNDSVARQSVLDQAASVAVSFRQSALGIQQVQVNVDSQTRSAVDSINRLAETIAGINRLYRASAAASQDAGLDAQLHAALEELAGYANYTLIRTADGAANVYLGGQTLLVVGDRTYPIQADCSGPQTAIRDFQGNDVAGQITRGQLGALLEEKSVLLPAYLTELNTLAASFADTVNAALAAGLDRSGQPPNTPLFAYDAGNGAAFTLAVNPLSPDEIAAAAAGAPGGNGNAIAIAQLGSAPVLAGFTFSQYYGNLAARIGRDVATARRHNQQYEDSVTQARAQRAEISGVSLDEEAARLLQFQQAYQAAGKLITVLDELSEMVIHLIR
jgi:flagellar hook-associated protein 1 FlgK